jgi:uncharacterized protein YjbJ (UPF0337 family)
MGGQDDKVAGKAKEFVGKVTGDKDMETEGRVQNVKGRVQKAAKDVVDKAKGAARAVRGKSDGAKNP